MHEEENDTLKQPNQESYTSSVSAEQQELTEGIDYSKDFIWGSDQDEYVDES